MPKVTNNIYDSWRCTLDTLGDPAFFKGLDELNAEELNHLKWLIEEQIRVLENNMSKSCNEPLKACPFCGSTEVTVTSRSQRPW